MKEKVDKLEKLIKVQCMDGNWDYDPYMHGMANGMLLAMSVITDKKPVFLEQPKDYLYTKVKKGNKVFDIPQ